MNSLVRHVLAAFATMLGAQAAAQDPDTADWERARSIGTLEALEGYLTAHPAGRHSKDAFLMIVRQAGESAPDIEPTSRQDGIVPAAGPDLVPALY